ncbi:MAG: TatD family hydrolase [Patescibacteria group bacterium]
MLIDSHTHIHFLTYDADREAVIQHAQKAGIKMICVGTQSTTSESAIKLAEKYPKDIWATVGFHPNHLSEEWHHDKKEQKGAAPENFDIEKLRALAKNPKVVAIGECGLDYYRLGTSEMRQIKMIKEKQKEVFLAQAKLAQELDKALMIHCRPSKGTDDAYEDLSELLKANRYKLKTAVHFYVGGLEITKKLVEAGLYFTFGGVITFARDYDEVIKFIPLERILLETDAPYVAPEPYRGKRNEPAYIAETAKKLSELKEVSLERIAEQTTANALKIFKISL